MRPSNPRATRAVFLGSVAAGAFGGPFAAAVTVVLASWALAQIRSPFGEPPWSWAWLFIFALTLLLLGALAAWRRRSIVSGVFFGLAVGMAVSLAALFLAVGLFRASHPAGFYFG